MSNVKWRLVLSFSGIVVALALFQLALQEEQSMHRLHPGMFYNRSQSYIPTALAVSYCLNAPSLILSRLVNNFLTRQFGWDERWFHYDMIEYYVFLFSFWWCVGWRLDNKSKPQNRTSPLALVASSLGLVFAAFLACCGIFLPGREEGTRAIPASMLLWGLGLILYFGRQLVRASYLRERRQ
jgi:hypothetical protein